MRKLFLPVLLLAVLLAACSGRGAESTPVPTVEPTIVAAQLEPTADASFECQPFSILPKPRSIDSIGLPEVSETDNVIGDEDAEMTLVVYSDFECPYCALAAEEIASLQAANPGKVRFVFRHFPLNSHPKAAVAAQAAEAAALQGKFFEMHDALFAGANAKEWQELSDADFNLYLAGLSEEIGLDVEKFADDLFSDAVVERVQADSIAATALQLGGTPSVFTLVDGQVLFVPGDEVPYDQETQETLLDLLKLGDKDFDGCPEQVIDPAKDYTATIKTEQGDITIQLLPDVAPVGVNSFVFLAQNDYYDGVSFHRVLPGFMAQGGDPSGTGFGGPGYRFKNETSEDLLFDRAGLVAYANSGVDTNGSQFFITYDAAPHLNGGYTIFGEVIEGMDVVEKLSERDPENNPDAPEGDLILDIVITER